MSPLKLITVNVDVNVNTTTERRRMVMVLSSSSVCQNVTANHRVNDAVFTEDGAQMVTGRFMYGPLDMVTLTGEKV